MNFSLTWKAFKLEHTEGSSLVSLLSSVQTKWDSFCSEQVLNKDWGSKDELLRAEQLGWLTVLLCRSSPQLPLLCLLLFYCFLAQCLRSFGIRRVSHSLCKWSVACLSIWNKLHSVWSWLQSPTWSVASLPSLLQGSQLLNSLWHSYSGKFLGPRPATQNLWKWCLYLLGWLESGLWGLVGGEVD